MRLQPRKHPSEDAAGNKQFFRILISVLFVFLICTGIFILALHYKTQADRAAKALRYERSFRPYLDHSEAALQSAREAVLSPDEGALSGAYDRLAKHRSFLDQIILTVPDYPEAYRLRGRIRLFARDLDGADRDFETYAKLTREVHKAGEFHRAETALLRMLRAAALDLDAEELTRDAAEAGRAIQAYLDWVQEVTQLRIDEAIDLSRIPISLAMHFAFQGDWQDAYHYAELSLEFNPGEPAAHGLVALCRLHLPSVDGEDALAAARARLEHALKISRLFPETWGLLGLLHLKSGDPKQAERAFTAAISLDPTFTEALLGLGRALNGQGRHAQAVETFADAMAGEKAREIPPSWRLRVGRAQAHYGRHRSAGTPEAERDAALTEALADLAAALQLAPAEPDVRIERARIYEDQGALDRALQDLDAAVQARPDHPEARSARARVRIAAGRRTEALVDLEALERLDASRGLGLAETIRELRARAENLPKK